MATPELSVVTGAFGYTGKYITRRLLSMGQRVRTLTVQLDRPNPFGEQVGVAPLDFDDPEGITRSLRGATTLYNTYWVRFPRGQVTFEKAVQNSSTLVEAAKEAGVGRLVHISHVNASTSSPLPYFRGKGLVDEFISRSGLSYAIVRPSLVFGRDDILINNVAWALRRFPVFTIFGSGEYRLQPVSVEDVARIAVTAAHEDSSQVIDAIGPETHTWDGLVRLIAGAISKRVMLVHMRPGLALALSRLLGLMVGDVMVTRDEVKGLMANLLVSEGGAPTSETRLSEWLVQNSDHLGRTYASELDRHYR